MKSFPLFRLVLMFACVVLGGAVSVRAEDLGAIKTRMKGRHDSVISLKDRGVAGENNRGFLEVRGSASAADQQVISDENSDRRSVYAALAQQTGATADSVGRQRAQQLASLAKRGYWIQEQNGEWKQKS